MTPEELEDEENERIWPDLGDDEPDEDDEDEYAEDEE